MELETSYLMDPDLLPDQVDLHTDPDQQSSLSALDGIADDDVNQNKNTRKKGAGGNKVTSEVQFYELSVSPTIFEYKACVHQRSGLTTYQIKLIYVLLLVSVSIMICLALSSLQVIYFFLTKIKLFLY